MPSIRKAHFDADIQRARDLVGLGQSLGAMTHGRVDASDLYRAALTQAVAALDSYIHGVVLDRAVDILMARVPPAGGRTKVGLHFSAVQQIVSAATPAEMELAARTHVAGRLSLETFQRPDAIASALAMVGVAKVWTAAFPALAGAAKISLGLVVERRNRIVHQCDADPLTPGSATPLSAQDALDSISVVDATVAAIEPHC